MRKLGYILAGHGVCDVSAPSLVTNKAYVEVMHVYDKSICSNSRNIWTIEVSAGKSVRDGKNARISVPNANWRLR